ncbi:copper resistance protein CopC [Sporosarcina luteola]|uniref:copper resistance CopC family protein n=1 Tax=Sporosarcina luteola TaxID=582850 RepID=UPI00203D3626|nr:copper resistance CopC family protein [Sporosarcina luteola]MCM3638194.1 copper resistance protein CopC [Sporosarcina luteola]
MKRIISATLILLFAFSSSAYAHTGLTSSSPAEGDEIAENVYEIVLEFNTKIESTSTVKVFNENNEEFVGNTMVNENVMTSGFNEPLDNGTYTVEWKIIGADGHPIQGTYSFMVNQEELDDPAPSEETPELSAEEVEEEPVEQPVEVTSKIASNDVLVVILVILFTIAGGFFGWVIGRRQTK